jgi:CRISPR-associated protein Csd1
MPSIARLLVKTTAVQEKFENVPPLLGGDLARTVLGGGPYPRTWLTAALIRLRAGDDPTSGWHAAAIKACLNRNAQDDQEEMPVSLKEDHQSQAYQLGRLFAVIEAAQRAALGKLNASVADRYYASASATPARVFASLLRNARNHISDLKKRGSGFWFEKRLDEIIARLPPDLPRTLKLEDQGRFAIGYYHERAQRRAKFAEGDAIEDQDAEPADAGATHNI